jgi:hypothetical protein
LFAEQESLVVDGCFQGTSVKAGSLFSIFGSCVINVKKKGGPRATIYTFLEKVI